MGKEYKFIDPEQRAQLLSDYTERRRKESLVGEPPRGRVRKRPSMAVVKELWDELTKTAPLTRTRSNNALFYAARQMGYMPWEIERVINVGINRKEVMNQGKLIMEYGYQMSHAWAMIDEIVNG